jgi:hypothetical protein
VSTTLERKWFEAVASIESCVLCGRWGCQVSHSNLHRGMSQKSAPYFTAAICPECHFELDNGKLLTQEQRREMHARAVNLTHAKLIEAGRLVLT